MGCKLPRVSASMIVRNEEHFLDECLLSIVDEVDEIVIVDTGSTDRSIDIARKYGAKIIERPWTGDFSAARNIGLENATGDWILYIDADERLRVPAPGALRAAVSRPEAVALFVSFRPRPDFTPYREPRLFRRDDRIRFRGVIHETTRPDIYSVCNSDAMILEPVDIGIDHYGYEGDLTHKCVRNLPLLQDAVAKTPDRVFLWVDLAQALKGLGRLREAEAACWEAIALARGNPIAKQHCDGAKAWGCLIELVLDGDLKRAVELADQAVAEYPDNHILALTRAGVHFDDGAADTLLVPLQRLVAIDADVFADPLISYDKRVFREWPNNLLGAVYARLGRRREAGEAFARAAWYDPENIVYRAKASLFSSGSANFGT